MLSNGYAGTDIAGSDVCHDFLVDSGRGWHRRQTCCRDGKGEGEIPGQRSEKGEHNGAETTQIFTLRKYFVAAPAFGELMKEHGPSPKGIGKPPRGPSLTDYAVPGRIARKKREQARTTAAAILAGASCTTLPLACAARTKTCERRPLTRVPFRTVCRPVANSRRRRANTRRPAGNGRRR
jgi:hypothetical protein